MHSTTRTTEPNPLAAIAAIDQLDHALTHLQNAIEFLDKIPTATSARHKLQSVIVATRHQLESLSTRHPHQENNAAPSSLFPPARKL